MIVPRALVAGVAIVGGAALFVSGYGFGRLAVRNEPRAAIGEAGPPAPLAEERAQLALEQGRLAEAQKDVEAARAQLALERAQFAEPKARVGEPQGDAQATVRLRAAVNSALIKASDQLAANNYEAAIALYDEALKLDPSNMVAMTGRTGAIGAKAILQASAHSTGVGLRSFRSGTTTASSGPETGAGSAPEGFEESAGVIVRNRTTAAELPGKINFEFSPQTPKAGEKYTVKVALANQGTAPIALQPTLAVTTTINGRKLQGPIPALVKEVAPRQSALVFETQDFWKEDTTSWSMEVTLKTTRGETYRNQLTWK